MSKTGREGPCEQNDGEQNSKKVLKMKPMRKVITTKNAPKTLKTRHKVAVELARLLDSGEINIDNVFFLRRNLDGHLCAREA